GQGILAVRIDPDGKDALTRYRLLAGGNDASLVEIDLVTGRSHQARVHMASIGYPVLGDIRYGSEETNGKWRKRGIRRPLLHSYRIFFGELGGEIEDLSGMRITAPPAGDMESLCVSRGWRVPG
ncbi:MAG TPA: RNA pseudouridine synthase, partial [Aminivibrio sp.]|nr:RNA pseudouridine synthase [Aminivibrio sp.]